MPFGFLRNRGQLVLCESQLQLECWSCVITCTCTVWKGNWDWRVGGMFGFIDIYCLSRITISYNFHRCLSEQSSLRLPVALAICATSVSTVHVACCLKPGLHGQTSLIILDWSNFRVWCAYRFQSLIKLQTRRFTRSNLSKVWSLIKLVWPCKPGLIFFQHALSSSVLHFTLLIHKTLLTF